MMALNLSVAVGCRFFIECFVSLKEDVLDFSTALADEVRVGKGSTIVMIHPVQPRQLFDLSEFRQKS